MDAASGTSCVTACGKRFADTCSSDMGTTTRKRIKSNEGNITSSTSWRAEADRKYRLSQAVDNSDPFSLDFLGYVVPGRFGSVTKDIQDLILRRTQLVGCFYTVDPKLPHACDAVQNGVAPIISEPAISKVIDLDDESEGTTFSLRRIGPAVEKSNTTATVVIIDSDDENDTRSENRTCHYTGLNLPQTSAPGKLLMKDILQPSTQQPFTRQPFTRQPSTPGKLLMKEYVESNFAQSQSARKQDAHNSGELGYTKDMEDKGEYVGTDDDSGNMSDTNSDGLGDIWNEMNFAMESSKDAGEDAFFDEPEVDYQEECEHAFILRDDIGDVCRICGVIKRKIENIIEYNFSKASKSTRTYRSEGRVTRELDQTEILPDGFNSSGDFSAAEIYPHPRHRKEMKPHQVEGFNFLLSNLVTDNPGGCIMAHAPGSGKTFMIISFLQSFMAKYPAARPLVVLPKGILSIWKKEFLRWQVEEIPLYDFYSVKADSRVHQLEVLKKWEKERSILFLGYKQFSAIISDTDGGQIAESCQTYLLKVPTLLILDEGHTPRNQDTDVLTTLDRVETPRKVVLSGTLYQNHVQEVFNILNLVRPRFLKLETSKAIKKRILSRVEISGRKNKINDHEFCELIEHTLTKDENHTRKVTVIQDLRAMTKEVLHYYKGDNLDELPGLVDFSVFVRLTPKQKAEVKDLRALGRKFTISAQGSAIFVHPKLKTLAKNAGVKDRVDEERIDAILEKFDVTEGVKAKFYLNLLQLCESSGEKVLVFSQYLLPLKFLERMTAKLKGYTVGREMFMITGDSDAETRETYMEKFNNSNEARVFFGSIKACGEGISLVGASRIIVLDVPLNPSVTRQAIGRAFRPGQVRKVYTYRLIASGSPEEDDHTACFRKECIAKMWFEWDHCSGQHKFEMDTLDASDCGDEFLETSRLKEDVINILKR